MIQIRKLIQLQLFRHPISRISNESKQLVSITITIIIPIIRLIIQCSHSTVKPLTMNEYNANVLPSKMTLMETIMTMKTLDLRSVLMPMFRILIQIVQFMIGNTLIHHCKAIETDVILDAVAVLVVMRVNQVIYLSNIK